MSPALTDWTNFYLMIGAAAAALTGLILVAISLHARAILGHTFYRDRSFTSLLGLVAIVLLSSAALAPQPIGAFGIEVFLLGIFWFVRLIRFIRLIQREGAHASAHDRRFIWLWEWLAWTIWVVALLVSGAMIWTGDTRALYVPAIWAATGLGLMVWNAWVLVAEVSG